MLLTELAIAPASIRHRRYLPKSHQFEAKLNYLWFDPDQIHYFTEQSYLWSSQRWNLLKLDPNDFLIEEYGTIRQKIEKILLKQANSLLGLDTQIRVLALPRTLGYRFNSVVFFFIFDASEKPLFILSEITNTPWEERKVYVHDCRDKAVQHSQFNSYKFEFKKSFHVSPFMPMDINYKWSFNFSAQQNVIHMQLFQQDVLQFDATMRFSLTPITVSSQQHRYAIHSVFEPFKMMAGIYLNAFRLWKKKVPFYRHPNKQKGKTKR
ncbi:DUF1365 domain-containing protein [Acinetobacter bereziniae]|jgi:DUF1365 family protein|uniref:DUF1365 domain-containing protein n=1 Tax=Acinetobacter bereziniae TaxID=106648 RepID=UPI00124EDD56|nr:DUF1365 domain-containing protein [Acinetobacter bereziniae]MBJ8551152.1 DUF1365 domain-containing protein [Acinetobacter bereziniae]MCU4434058.1 DUF1365 domain-containing protein [Acinetobacter bereziniae]MCV2442159.1 DUF1365 domain-containing protein [Acinetobacter bereziniae]MDA3441366.1 DUF1365 domain-containing protein [Acinetobacter bereziniae]MDR6539975.1 DUF1365 family protein [Acinetobacter bereziniae]